MHHLMSLSSDSRRGAGARSRLALAAWLSALLAVSGTCLAQQATELYKVGPDDVIYVTVARHPEFSGEFFVPNDGRINVPAVGEVEVSGRTLSEIAESISHDLRDRLRQPEVTVSLRTPRAQKMYVLGAVDRPGAYDVKAGWRITEAVAAAGGLARDVAPAECKARVDRASSESPQLVEFAEALRGNPKANVPLLSGDVLTIDTPEVVPVYVIGRVRTPGLYKLPKESAGLMEALTLAGGTMNDSAVSRITITRVSGASEQVSLTSATETGKADGARLRPGDVVLVPEQTARVAVLGYVNEPGFFPVRDDQSVTLTDALGLAKGTINKRANIGAITVLRKVDDKQQRMQFDLHKFLKSGDASHNPVIVPGDVVYVPQTGRPDPSNVLDSLATIGLLIAPFVY